MGLANTSTFYTNIFALAGANGVTMELDLLDADGTVLDTAAETLEAYEPWLSYKTNIWDIGSFSEGTLRAKVTSGSAAILGSLTDSRSVDPTTLESAFGGGAGSRSGAGGSAGQGIVPLTPELNVIGLTGNPGDGVTEGVGGTSRMA